MPFINKNICFLRFNGWGAYLTVDSLGATEIFSPHQDERFERNFICKKQFPWASPIVESYPIGISRGRTCATGISTFWFFKKTFVLYLTKILFVCWVLVIY